MLAKIFSLGKIGCSGACACGGGGGGITCSPCTLPASDLTLSYTNVISGNGSVTLTYDAGTTSWSSGCSLGIMYKLVCTTGTVELRAIYFTSGSCPTGTQQYCSNLRVSPFKLTLASYTCSPLSITFTLAGSACPALLSNGFTSFVVTV